MASQTNYSGRNPPPTRVIRPEQVPPPEPTQPETTLIECNRYNSVLKSDTNNTLWTSEFAGGINIRKGDQLRIHSAYLSSRGVADLISYVQDANAPNYDAEANWIMEFYVSNDGKNNKRNGYNLNNGKGVFLYDQDNRPMRVFRRMDSFSTLPSLEYPTFVSRPDSDGEVSYNQDPYMPARIKGANWNILGYKQFDVREATDPICFAYKITLTIPNALLQTIGGGLVPPGIDVGDRVCSCLVLATLDQAGTITYIKPSGYFPQSGALQLFPIQTGFANEVYYPRATFQFAQYGGLILDTQVGIPNTDPLSGVEAILINDTPYEIGAPGTLSPITTCQIQWVRSQQQARYEEIEANDDILILPPPGLTNWDKEIEKQGDIVYQYKAPLFTTDYIVNNWTIVNDEGTGGEPMEMKISKTNYDDNTFLTDVFINTVGTSVNPELVEFTFDTSKFNFTNIDDIVTANNNSSILMLRLEREDPALIAEFGIYEYVQLTLAPDTQGGMVADAFLSAFNRLRCENRAVYRCFGQTPTQAQALKGDIYSTKKGYKAKIMLYGYALNNAPNTAGFSNGTELEMSSKTVKQYMSISPEFPTSLTTEPRINTYSFLGKAQNGEILNEWETGSFGSAVPVGTSVIESGRNMFGIFNPTTQQDYLGSIFISNSNYIETVPDNEEVIHYRQKRFKIEDDYASPSDVADELTLQTHELTDARTTQGYEIPGTKAISLPQNEFVFPVYSADLTADIGGQTIEEPGRGNGYDLTNEQPVGAFYCKNAVYNMKAYPVLEPGTNTPSILPEETDGELPNGTYRTFFQTQFTSINKPLPPNPKTDEMPQKNIQDFDQSSNPQFSQTFLQDAPVGGGQVITGYPINYLNDVAFDTGYGQGTEGKAKVSQFCGSDNVAFVWSDTESRFTVQFLHQPAVSIFYTTPTGVSQGGEQSTTIYYPSPVGYEGYPYKANQTRTGGVNLVNWCSKNFSFPSTPAEVREIAKFFDYTVDLGTDWFINGSNPNFAGKLTNNWNYSPVANRFWNKLGYTDNQLAVLNVGSTTDPIADYYIPLGTTDARVDSAFSILSAEPPPATAPYFDSNGDFAGTSGSDTQALEARYKYSSVGSQYFNNSAYGYSTPSTAGLPIQYEPIPAKPDAGKGLDSANPEKTTQNPDKNRITGFTVQANESEKLKAISLPIKTTDAYYYIMTDLINTNFYISNNRGTKLNCVGLVSKLNGSNDFYFSYGSPQSFFFKEDKTITSIQIEIRTPDLLTPPAISPYSSVIFEIVRENTAPLPDMPSVDQQQMEFAYNLAQFLKAQPQEKPIPQNQIISELAQTAFTRVPDQAEIIEALQAEAEAIGQPVAQRTLRERMEDLVFPTTLPEVEVERELEPFSVAPPIPVQPAQEVVAKPLAKDPDDPTDYRAALKYQYLRENPRTRNEETLNRAIDRLSIPASQSLFRRYLATRDPSSPEEVDREYQEFSKQLEKEEAVRRATGLEKKAGGGAKPEPEEEPEE